MASYSGPSPNQSAPIAPISMGDEDPVPVVTGDLVRELTDYKQNAMDGDADVEASVTAGGDHASSRQLQTIRAPSRASQGSVSTMTMEQFNNHNNNNTQSIIRDDLATMNTHHEQHHTAVNSQSSPHHQSSPRRYLTDADDDATAEQPNNSNGNSNTNSKKKNSSSKKLPLAVMIGIAILVLGGVAVGAVCGTGNCSASSAPESSSSSSTQDGTTTDGSPDDDTPGDDIISSTLSAIRNRGTLQCGVSTAVGFSSINDDGERVGFDVDLCRAVAAAIFGDPSMVTFVDVTRTNRFVLLNDDRVDMLAARTTHTMERDTFEETTQTGFSFSVPYFFSGMRFGGIPPFVSCADAGNLTFVDDVDGSDCADLTICVEADSIFVPLVEDLLPGVPVFEVGSLEEEYLELMGGRCNVLAGGELEVTESVVRGAGFNGPDYEVGEFTHAKEPLCIVTRDADPTWSDFVNWILEAIMAAEERGDMQVDALQIPTTQLFGPEYADMFANAVGAVGNYGELYERNLARIVPRSIVNEINTGTTGLIYALPFGRTEVEAPNPIDGSTLKAIQDRGHLRCGVARRSIFAVLDGPSQAWNGHDVDFCKAISAAIFDGVTNTIIYIDLPATERFRALDRGDVDVLSRITTVTFSRDVNETATGRGFSFTQPNFYDGLGFGGIPPYGDCADRLDTISAACSDLKVCVNDGTTFARIVGGLFDEDHIERTASGDLVVEGLATGACNAIAGGVADLSQSNIQGIGQYTGPYQAGTRLFSKDPLALVTRQDDPQWSAFCFWIVSGLFYADEEGITSGTSNRMPIVNLFGPLHFRMLRDAVSAVGSFADIYERNVGSEFARQGLNEVNVNGQGPQLYPLPGV